MPITNEDNFWTDEKVIEFMKYFKNDFSKGFPKIKAMEYFKNSFPRNGLDVYNTPFSTTLTEILNTIKTGGQVEDKLVFMVKNKINGQKTI